MASQMIELIKILRERTGAGMMDCKKALEENELDVEKAIDWLRKKGIAKAAKKAGRIAAEGLTFVKYCEKCGHALILEINCETDFVANSPAFHEFVEACAKEVMKNDVMCLDCCKKVTQDLFNDATMKMGEKLDFRRYEKLEIAEGQGVGTYMHMGGKLSTLVILEKPEPEFANNLAMSITANGPLYISKEDIPADVLARETAVQTEASKNDPKLAGKPEAALAKIIEGKVSKALSDQVLLEQEYLLEPGKKVADVLAEHHNKVVKFIRYQVGEGLEKRVDNFAEEVMSQAQ